LLAIWFLFTYLLGGLWAAKLNEIVIIGFPLGYYIAAQGSLAVFVIEIALYAKLMNAKDLEYGIREEA
jgi:putative solute:sodium symporter small subunit